ncbi:hypothetical protein [Bacillus cereus group sp. BfR-BA-01350]|uniref:hypothetical protein n=1 Tax=Bacillus cereus group sp. BfR-BA-01350 TaxID=2920313 RepID=UPI001F590E3F|nr:hypothetical protein [Bacillus cereus group sp. BfR-BA-01350]
MNSSYKSSRIAKKECFISTHIAGGPGENTPLEYLLNAGEKNVTLYQSYTNTPNNSLIQLSVPLSTSPNGPLFISIESQAIREPITDVITAGQTKLYEVEDFKSLIVTNGTPNASIFFTLFIQNTFCICCNNDSSSNCN